MLITCWFFFCLNLNLKLIWLLRSYNEVIILELQLELSFFLLFMIFCLHATQVYWIYSVNFFILYKDTGQLTVRRSNKSAQMVVIIIRNCQYSWKEMLLLSFSLHSFPQAKRHRAHWTKRSKPQLEITWTRCSPRESKNSLHCFLGGWTVQFSSEIEIKEVALV